MTLFIILTAVIIVVACANSIIQTTADVVATVAGAYYYWRFSKLSLALLASKLPAADFESPTSSMIAHRHLMARALRATMALTAHASMFPRTSRKARAMVDTLLLRKTDKSLLHVGP